MQEPGANWRYMFLGLRAETEERLGPFARASPALAIVSSAGIGFVLGLVLPQRVQVAALAPFIGSAVERLIEAKRPQLHAGVSQAIGALRSLGCGASTGAG